MIMDIYEPDEGLVRLFGQLVVGVAFGSPNWISAGAGSIRACASSTSWYFWPRRGSVAPSGAHQGARVVGAQGLIDWRLRKVSISPSMQQKVQFISTMLHDRSS